MRLIVEAIIEYDSKLYAKSNSSASQEIPDFDDDYDVDEEEEAKTEEEVPACAPATTTGV